MGIDGIGGGGLPPGGVGGPGGPKGPKGVGGKEFEVDGSAASSKVGSTQASEALGRLEAGEISIDQYLDTRVQEAVSHLEGKLPADQLDFVRQSLRQELETDPVLVELVRRATGVSPGSAG
ncbi:MAG: hypothetical protein H6718_22055 [Polyangiaceae bacterium]|nr:hypothetical protein [Polyangiaceae bacterium]